MGFFSKMLQVLILIMVLGCGKHLKVSGAEFQEIYESINLNSNYSMKYLGHRNDEVFLIFRSASLFSESQWKEKIIYADVKDLEPAFREELLMVSDELSDVPKIQ